MCSCLGCGNQRRYEGKTLQERRAELSVVEDCHEADCQAALSTSPPDAVLPSAATAGVLRPASRTVWPSRHASFRAARL